MNNGPTAPALNDPPLRSSDELVTRDDRADDAGYTADIEHRPSDDTNATNGIDMPPSPNTSAINSATATLQPWEERFTAKRKASLDSLFGTLDSLVYLELVVLYCFDISTLLLLLRLSTHITPFKDLTILPPHLRPSQKTTSLFPILLINTLAIIYHLIFTLPQAGEATRFDLQGHILVDFVGQRVLTGWSGRCRLVGLDVLVLGLQCVGCGVLAIGEKKGAGVMKDAGADIGAAAESGAGRQQIEQGEEGIEMQPLMRSVGDQDEVEVPSSSAQSDLEAQNHDTAHGQEVGEGSSADTDTLARDGLEALYSGQAVLVDICFWTLLRDQYYERRNRALAGRV